MFVLCPNKMIKESMKLWGNIFIEYAEKAEYFNLVKYSLWIHDFYQKTTAVISLFWIWKCESKTWTPMRHSIAIKWTEILIKSAISCIIQLHRYNEFKELLEKNGLSNQWLDKKKHSLSIQYDHDDSQRFKISHCTNQ